MVNRVGRTLRDCTPGSRMGTVIVNFGTRLHANPQTAQKMQELAAHVCTGCCSQLISRMFSEVAHIIWPVCRHAGRGLVGVTHACDFISCKVDYDHLGRQTLGA